MEAGEEPGADSAQGRCGTGFLWLDKLSRITTSRGRNVGAN